MTHTGLKYRSKISKRQLKRMIECGAFSMSLADGSKVTDWKQIEDRYEVFRDVDTGEIRSISIAGRYPGWTERQLEHVGDALFCLAARLLVRDFFGARQCRYFMFAEQFLANDVMGGTQAEIEVGMVFVDKGMAEAVAFATEMLKRTDVYKNMITYDESLKASPNWQKQKSAKRGGPAIKNPVWYDPNL